FKVDYISASRTYPSNYGTLGMTRRDDGIIVGSAASVIFASTSLTKNLNKPPFLNNLTQYTVDSPTLNDPNSPLWEYRDIYTVIVDKSAFGSSRFSGVSVIQVHNSPAKSGAPPMPPTCPITCLTNVATVTATAGLVTLSDQASARVCLCTN